MSEKKKKGKYDRVVHETSTYTCIQSTPSRHKWLYASLKLRALYKGAPVVHERHRHRYEVNPDYIDVLEQKAGLNFVGKDDTGNRMEVVERRDHPGKGRKLKRDLLVPHKQYTFRQKRSHTRHHTRKRYSQILRLHIKRSSIPPSSLRITTSFPHDSRSPKCVKLLA